VTRLPVELGSVARWIVYGVLAYLALRLIITLLRPSRR
jgi:hypothetical protein